jgi:hypothetical protein
MDEAAHHQHFRRLINIHFRTEDLSTKMRRLKCLDVKYLHRLKGFKLQQEIQGHARKKRLHEY